MPSRQSDSFLSTSIEICEVFQQFDKPPTCGSHRLRKLSSCIAKQQEVGRESQHPCGKTHCGLLIPTPELERFLRDIDHCVGQRAGDFMAASRVPDLEHCNIQFVGQHRLCKNIFFTLKSDNLGSGRYC